MQRADNKRPSFILPPELQSQIVQHCSQRELASLARVHSSYRAESEKALYEIAILRVTKELDDLNKVSSVTSKAELVKSLLIIIIPSDSADFQITFSKICDHLPIMVNLVDLRIRIHPLTEKHLLDTVTQALDKTIRQCSFKLDTLFCNAYLDLPSHVEQYRQSLRIFGLYSSGGGPDYKSLLQHIQKFYSPSGSSTTFTRTAFILDSEGSHGLFSSVSLFPTFNNPGDPPLLIALADQVITAIEKFPFPSSMFRLTFLTSIKMLYHDVSQMVQTLASDAAVPQCHFPSVMSLDIHFSNDNQSDTYPDLTPLVTYLPSLQKIWFFIVEFDTEHSVSSQFVPSPKLLRRNELAEKCRDICPELSFVYFGDRSPPITMQWTHEGGWSELLMS